MKYEFKSHNVKYYTGLTKDWPIGVYVNFSNSDDVKPLLIVKHDQFSKAHFIFNGFINEAIDVTYNYKKISDNPKIDSIAFDGPPC